MPRALARFGADRRGTAAVIVGICLATVVGAAAVAADVSVFYVQKRKLQSATDAAALFASANPGRDASGSAMDIYRAYGLAPASLVIAPGTYDRTQALGSRFAPGAGGNAVSIVATAETPMIFGRFLRGVGGGKTTVTIGAGAKAAALPVAAYAIGSRTAAVSGGIANLVLGAVLGGSLTLSALDYQSLASARIDVAGALGAVNARLGSPRASYADLLATSVPVSLVLSSIATGTGPAAGAVLSALAAAAAGGGSLTLGSLIDLGPAASLAVGTPLPVQVTASGYDLVAALARTVGSGRTFALDLGAAVPGVASATTSLQIVQTAPSYVVAPWNRATVAATQQAQIAIKVGATVPGLGEVRLPIALTLARAVASTGGPTCSGGTAQLALAVTPSLASVSVGTDGAVPVPVATILGLAVYASATASIANAAAQTQTFTAADVAAGTIKTTALNAPTASLVATALGQARFSLGAPGAQPLQPLQLSGLAAALAVLAAPADLLLDGVAQAIGLQVGSADTWASDLRCGSPQLVE